MRSRSKSMFDGMQRAAVLDNSPHPYRSRLRPAVVAPRANPEDVVVYILLIVIGSLPIIDVVGRVARWGGAATLGAAMVLAGLLGILRTIVMALRHRRHARHSDRSGEELFYEFALAIYREPPNGGEPTRTSIGDASSCATILRSRRTGIHS